MTQIPLTAFIRVLLLTLRHGLTLYQQRRTKLNVDDYTQSVSKVMSMERVYTYPLSPESVIELWQEWKSKNYRAMDWFYFQAREFAYRGARVSAKYLIEKLRYESGLRIESVPFTDNHGVLHTFGISNTLTPFIGRWLKGRIPELDIQINKSRFDAAIREAGGINGAD